MSNEKTACPDCGGPTIGGYRCHLCTSEDKMYQARQEDGDVTGMPGPLPEPGWDEVPEKALSELMISRIRTGMSRRLLASARADGEEGSEVSSCGVHTEGISLPYSRGARWTQQIAVRAATKADAVALRDAVLSSLLSASAQEAAKPDTAGVRAAPKNPPAPGTTWRHTNGNRYEVLHIANEQTQDAQRYPVTVVYRGLVNGLVWTRAADDWHRSMTQVSE